MLLQLLVQPKRFVYIVTSLKVPATYYVGLTSEMDARLAFQNAGLTPSTAKARPRKRLVVISLTTSHLRLHLRSI